MLSEHARNADYCKVKEIRGLESQLKFPSFSLLNLVALVVKNSMSFTVLCSTDPNWLACAFILELNEIKPILLLFLSCLYKSIYLYFYKIKSNISMVNTGKFVLVAQVISGVLLSYIFCIVELACPLSCYQSC